MKLEEIRRSIMLVSAIRLAKKSERRGPLWGLVSAICGTGSTTACEICRECGWDPGQPASKEVRWNPDMLQSERRVPPHPGPLPGGEGELFGSPSGVAVGSDGGAR